MSTGIYPVSIVYRRRNEEVEERSFAGYARSLAAAVAQSRPLHGLGVSDRIAQITQGAFKVKPGSLFPALHRLEEAGWLKASWDVSDNNRRAKYYRLTK